jgi:uncharacterized glyoxalase superfamily protein PhnB
MAPSYKPPGHTSISPYLIVNGAAETIEFVKRTFGAVEVFRFADASGRLLHSEVRIDDSIVMIADAVEGWPPVGAHVHVYVPDVDEAYRLALEAGAESVQAPVRKNDPDKRGGVRDPRGITWWLATRAGP